MARKIRLYSPLDPVPLARLLKEEMDRKTSKEEREAGRIIGHGSEEKMMLFHKRFGKAFIPGPVLTAEMFAHDGGTLIEGRLGLPRFSGCFMGIWALGLGMVLLLFQLFLAEPGWHIAVVFLVLGFPMLLLIVGFWVFVRTRASVPRDEEKILTFLREFADAEPL